MVINRGCRLRCVDGDWNKRNFVLLCCRLTRLTIQNNGWDHDAVLLPEAFPTAMHTLQHIDINWRGEDKQLVHDAGLSDCDESQ